MTGQPVASEPKVFSADPDHEDTVLAEQCAITVPFIRKLVNCECPWEIRSEEPLGCKNCDPVRTMNDLKSQAIRQTQKRWSWFSEARKLDDELSTRLGTLGLLPWEIRDIILCLVLNEYMEESIGIQLRGNPLHISRPASLTLLKTDNVSKDLFGTKISRAHMDIFQPVYGYCLKNYHSNPFAWFLSRPFRLATPDMKFEFDRILLTTTFRFHDPEALYEFLSELSADQRSLLRSITLVISSCSTWLFEKASRSYRVCERMCAQLPSTLGSIKFEIGYHMWLCFGCIDTLEEVESIQRAKDLLEFLVCQVRRIALEANITVVQTKPFDCDVPIRDALNAVVGETDDWSKEYVDWKKRDEGETS